MGFLDKLKNIVRFAKITGPADNAAQFPVQQMEFKGKVVNVLQVFPYGVYANVSSEDALGIMFAIDGSENNRAAIAYTPQKRPVDLEQGEVAYYHPQTNSFIKFRNNGDLEIDTVQDGASNNIIINCENATVNANANADINCTNSTVTASSSVTLDTPATTITGTLNVQGAASLDSTLAVTGAVTASSSVTASGEVTGSGVALSTHVHGGISPGGSNTGAPV